MGVLKNDVGRPSNKTIMIRRIFKALLVVLLVVGCYFAGYKFGNSFDNKKENKGTTKKEEVVKITDDEVKDLYNKFNRFDNALDIINLSQNSNKELEYLYTYFYQEKLENKDVADEIKFAIAYNELYAEKVEKLIVGSAEYNNFKLYLDDMNEKSEELFGTKINVDNILYDGIAINKGKKMLKVGIYGTSWSYNQPNKTFSHEYGGVGGCDSAYYSSKIISIERKVGKVEVISKPMFVYESGCDGNIYKIFKAANKETKYYNLSDEVVDLTGKLDFDSTEEQQKLMQKQLEEYSDKLDSYKWTFVQTEKGNFIFDSVEKITK